MLLFVKSKQDLFYTYLWKAYVTQVLEREKWIKSCPAFKSPIDGQKGEAALMGLQRQGYLLGGGGWWGKAFCETSQVGGNTEESLKESDSSGTWTMVKLLAECFIVNKCLPPQACSSRDHSKCCIHLNSCTSPLESMKFITPFYR